MTLLVFDVWVAVHDEVLKLVTELFGCWVFWRRVEVAVEVTEQRVEGRVVRRVEVR